MARSLFPKSVLLSILTHVSVLLASWAVLRASPIQSPSSGVRTVSHPLLNINWGKIRQQAKIRDKRSSNETQSTISVDESSPTSGPTGPISASNSSFSDDSAGPMTLGPSDPYYVRVRESIQSKLRYPTSLARRRIQGQTQILLTLRPSGEIADLSITSSSGYGELDRQALDAARAASPYESFSAEDPARVIRLPIDFRAR